MTAKECRSAGNTHTHCKNPENCEEPEIGICGSEESPSECYYRLTIDIYKSKLEDSKSDLFDSETKRQKLVAVNNQFRTMLLGPTAIESLVKDGVFDVSGIKLYTAKARRTWNDLSLETCIVFLNAHNEFAKEMADLVGTKHAKVSIKKELIRRTIKESAQATEFIRKEEETEKDKVYFKTRIGKAVKANMKNFGMTKDEAIKLVDSMGIKK